MKPTIQNRVEPCRLMRRERVERAATRERNDVSQAGCRGPRRSSNDAGSTLVEVVVSMLIMATLAAGLLSMSAIALTQSENQGHLAARTAEYAQDKMEQLLVLAYGDGVTDTRVFPAASLGGTGLAIGGSSNPATPVLGYADYLDANGNLLAEQYGGATGRLVLPACLAGHASIGNAEGSASDGDGGSKHRPHG